MGGMSIGSSMVESKGGSSMSSNNGSSMSSNNGGSDSADGDSGLVYADGVLVNDGGLHNMLDGVDSVGLRDSVGLFDLNGVRLGHMSVNNDFPFDGNGDSDGDGDLVPVHFKLGLNAGDLGGDSGVGADGSGDSLDSDGISRGGSLAMKRNVNKAGDGTARLLIILPGWWVREGWQHRGQEQRGWQGEQWGQWFGWSWAHQRHKCRGQLG